MIMFIIKPCKKLDDSFSRSVTADKTNDINLKSIK